MSAGLHFNAASLADSPSESEPCEPSPEQSYLAWMDDGSQNGTQMGDCAENVSHESEPRAAVGVSEEGGSGSNGSLGSQNTGEDQVSDEKGPAPRPTQWEAEL